MNRLLNFRKSLLPLRIVSALSAGFYMIQPAEAQDLGITISPSGIMLKDGKPYRSIGGNVPFDSAEFFENNNANYLQTFAQMKASGITTVRLSTKGWYAAWKLSYLSITDKEAYFAKMDAIVDAAAQNDVGVILLLFWWPSAVSDHYGEFELATSVPGTKSYAAMAQFATDMAEHYKDNPAVVGYDVINEMTLAPDQPNSGQSVNRRWTAEAVQAIYANVLPAIRAVDPTRMLSTGGTDARTIQYHMTNYSVWNPDTPAQMAHENDMAHPDPADVLGLHYYPDSISPKTNWGVYNALSLQRRKPYYVGEFGIGDKSLPLTVLAPNFNFALSELLRNRVPLMSDWYMGAPQIPGGEITSPGGTFGFVWNALAQAASQYHYGPWKNLAITAGGWNSAGSWASGAVPTTADDVYVPTDASARALTINSTAYARNLAVGNASTTDQLATLEITGSGQLVLGQNSSLTFATTSDGTTPTTVTVNGVHGQLLDNSSRSAILNINQSSGETKPAIVANTVSAYQMNTAGRANISAETTQLNLFDGMSVGNGAAATVYQTGGIVRIGLDANVVGGTPAGLVFSGGSGYVLSGGTLATSGISGTTNAILDWQGGTIRALDGASMSISPVVDIQLNGTGTRLLHVADANQSITVNPTAKISGSGNLTKSGPGKLTFLGTSSDYLYTGTTSINDGILQVKNAGALPGWNAVGKVSVGGRIASTLDGTVAAGTLALNVGGSLEWTTGNLTTILGASGRVTFGAGSALGIDTSNAAGTVTLTNQITGTKGITKLGNGTLTLNPGSSNTYTGMTTVLGGTLQLGATTNTIIPAASGFDVRGGTLDLGGKTVTFSGSYAALTDINNPQIEVQLPFLTQPSRVIFAGGIVQNGTITNNAQCTNWDSIYEGQSGTVSANLAGSVGLWKTTAGTLTLTGNNSFTGATRIAKGTLILGHANALGNTGFIEFMNGTLKYATGVTTDLSALFRGSYSAINIDTNGQTITFASPIHSSNASGLKKSGSGTLILTSASNAYTGGTWVEEGTLQTNANGVLSGANDLTVKAGAVLDLNGTSQSIGNLYSLGNGTGSIVNNKDGTQAALTVSGSHSSHYSGILSDHSAGTGTLALNFMGSGEQILSGSDLTYTGATVISSGILTLKDVSNFTSAITNNATLNFASSIGISNLFSGVITGTGSVRASGPGTVTLSGNYSYSGETILRGGILNVAHFTDYGVPGGLGNRSSDAFQSVGILFQGGTLQYAGASAQSTNRAIRISTSGGAIIDASGSVPSATLSFTATSSPNFFEYPGNRTITFTGTNTGTNTFGMAIAQAGGTTTVIKNGTGTWVLSGNNTYTGATSINAGTLKVTGSLHAGTSVTVYSSGTLMGTGTIHGPLTVNSGGTLAPGNSAGTLSSGTTTISGTYACEIDGATADRLTSVGNLTLDPGATLAFSTLNAPTVASYIIASYTGTLTRTFSNVTGKPVGYDVVYDAALKQIRLEIRNTWTGSINSIWDSSTANWTTPTTWNNGAVAVFGVGNWTLNVLGAITAANISGLDSSDTIQIGAGNSLQISNANLSNTPWANLTGAGALTIGGAGTVTLGTATTFTGTLTATSGTISFATLGSTAKLVMSGGNFTSTGNTTVGSLAVNSPGSLAVSTNYLTVGALTGSNALTVTGGNPYHSGLKLAGTSNIGFSGTIRTGASLYLAHENLLGTNPNALTMSGGILYDNGSPLTIANHSITLTGGIMIASTSSAGDITITGGITGTGGFTARAQSSRALVLGGTNTYAGDTNIYTDSGSNSTLRMAVTNALPSGTGKGNLSLTTWSAGVATLDLNGYSQTVNGLNISNSSAGNSVIDNVTAGGNVTLTVGGANATGQLFAGVIKNTTGTVHLTKIGSGTQTLAGANTYTGNTTISAGTLTLADNAQLKFVTGASSDVNNQISGSGTLVLNGDFVIDTTATDATLLASGSWQIESVASLAGAYGSTFTVVGWTDAGTNRWTKTVGAKNYTFDETTGTITMVTPYATWIAGSGLSGGAAAFDADPDHDGLANGIELVLGGEPNPANPDSNSTGLLPIGSCLSGDFVFTFKRKHVSKSSVLLTFQWSNDLMFLSPANDIPVAATNTVTNGVSVAITANTPDALKDTVVITVPASKLAGRSVFGRLKAVPVP